MQSIIGLIFPSLVSHRANQISKTWFTLPAIENQTSGKTLSMSNEDIQSSPLYSPDLAPIPKEERTWGKWNLAALWVGMAVCIPTYLLASYMIRSGLSWQAALIIIGLANLVITLPMVLNGHAGVKYGLPFPVIGRSAFGIRGIHLVSILRAIVACGWFGVQTWVGGLALYSIWNVLSGSADSGDLTAGKFFCFGIFWLVNLVFIWKGTESIKWLEDFSAPILILIGIVLLGWGYQSVGGFEKTLDFGSQLKKPAARLTFSKPENTLLLHLSPLVDKEGFPKADSVGISLTKGGILQPPIWKKALITEKAYFEKDAMEGLDSSIFKGEKPILVQFKKGSVYSSKLSVFIENETVTTKGIWDYILWFTAMVGFWATMSISISDITRFAKSQKDQLAGQFIGLPGTMIFYSFVGIFVTSAAIVAFPEILVGEDAPWDPVSLVARFKSPVVIVFAQLAMLIATLSTNIAANVIAPANAFSNLSPKHISFRQGGLIAGLVGVIICPWWLMNEISEILVFVSGLLGPVLGILLCDYYLIRKKELSVHELFQINGKYNYGGTGFHRAAVIALVLGMATALIGYWIPQLSWLYSLSWFTGFCVAFLSYYLLAKKQ